MGKQLLLIGSGDFANEVALIAKRIDPKRAIWERISYVATSRAEVGKERQFGRVDYCDEDILSGAVTADAVIALGASHLRMRVAERYAKVSSPESVRFPAGKKFGGTLNIVVQGAHAPLMQHLAPVIVERVNRFFGYSAVAKLSFRQGSPIAREHVRKRPQLRPVSKELGEGLREIADPELRACLEALAGQIEASDGPPDLDSAQSAPIPTTGATP